MMGRQATQRELFVSVTPGEYVPEDHLLRAVDRYLDLSECRANLPDATRWAKSSGGASCRPISGVVAFLAADESGFITGAGDP